MPVYTFVCKDCGLSTEINMSIQDYHNNHKCQCGSTNMQRDFCADNIVVDDGNPQTLGMLAEKNARKKKGLSR